MHVSWLVAMIIAVKVTILLTTASAGLWYVGPLLAAFALYVHGLWKLYARGAACSAAILLVAPLVTVPMLIAGAPLVISLVWIVPSGLIAGQSVRRGEYHGLFALVSVFVVFF